MNSMHRNTRQYLNFAITNIYRYYSHITLLDNTDKQNKTQKTYKILFWMESGSMLQTITSLTSINLHLVEMVF